MNGQIRAPFTPTQVTHLNQYQQSGVFHPFTCGKRDEHPENEGILVATEAGWTCPAEGCDYTQGWAHAAMADPGMIENARQIMAGMRTAHRVLELLLKPAGEPVQEAREE